MDKISEGLNEFALLTVGTIHYSLNTTSTAIIIIKKMNGYVATDLSYLQGTTSPAFL